MKNFFELSFVVIWFFFCLEHFGIYYVSLFPYFLAQKDDPVSSYTLPQLWNQPFLQRVLVPISGEWFWEAKKWVPIVEGMVLLLSLSCKWTKQGNILTYMHKGVYKFVSISIILFSHNYSNFCIICSAIWKTISLYQYIQFQVNPIQFILIFPFYVCLPTLAKRNLTPLTSMCFLLCSAPLATQVVFSAPPPVASTMWVLLPSPGWDLS